MFQGLLKKDFLIVKTYLWIWLAAVPILYAGGAAFASYHDRFYLVFSFLIALYVGHMVILPVAATILLRAEEKGQYWLHGTAGGKKLLSSKLLISALVMIASLFVTNILMLFSLLVAVPKDYSILHQGKLPLFEGVLFNGGIIFGAMYFTLWGLFLWSMFHSMSQYPILKKFRWIIIIAVYFIIQTIIARMTEWSAVKTFLQSWSIQVGSPKSNIGQFDGLSFTMNGGELLMWPIILSIVGFCLLFIAAGWLLDRKVEV
jgi:hypothetical protein